MGIYTPFVNDTSQEIISSIGNLKKVLKGMGAKIIEIEIPNLEPMQKAHSITIGRFISKKKINFSEILTAIGPYLRDHFEDLGIDIRLNLGVLNTIKATDYIVTY